VPRRHDYEGRLFFHRSLFHACAAIICVFSLAASTQEVYNAAGFRYVLIIHALLHFYQPNGSTIAGGLFR